MPIYIKGVIKIVEDASFKDAQTGAVVPYYVNYVQDPEGKLVRIASKTDFSELTDTIVVITATLRSDRDKPNLFKVLISDVKEEK